MFDVQCGFVSDTKSTWHWTFLSSIDHIIAHNDDSCVKM